ncbi:amino acid permease [Zhenpiania hominis]|uniref:Amino acid permease n=1 Tax=Zhenpiania hominis TaxID=2763644 RepID=A0A923NNH1_9FIRM|nr:amino acid permease [Zhenpiania hominis]MBC6680372.1 amino acid permease [Zhenpiania hominis]
MLKGGNIYVRSKKVEPSSENQELKRGIKGWQVSFIGLGGVIGSCYFLGVGTCLGEMGPAVLIAFAIVGVIVYGLMIAYAELLVNLPRKGSFVAYTNEFLGETLSTGMGWSFWFNWVCYVPSEAVAVATVLQYLTGSTSGVFYVACAVGALLALTIINLCAVDIFAKIESGLAITKVCVIILFIILAFGIWVGLWGSDHFLGGSVNFGGDEGFVPQMFPKGMAIVFTSMTVVLVTFQGTEIVGLAAAEAQDPEKSVPRACKSVTYRIAGLYMVPILLIVLIYPWNLGTEDNPIFADIMNRYNMGFFGIIMSAVVLIAAFSCANTGFYGTVRAMFGLSIEGLAPKFLSKLTKTSNPRNAALFTLLFMWIVLIIGLVSELTGAMSSLYANLLSLSGFTGTLAWVGICASQLVFRKRLKKRGYDPETCLKARVKKGQTWLPAFAMIAQIIFLIMMAFGEGQFPAFCLATASVIVPMIIRVIARKTGHVRNVNALSHDEKSFDETFPDLNK